MKNIDPRVLIGNELGAAVYEYKAAIKAARTDAEMAATMLGDGLLHRAHDRPVDLGGLSRKVDVLLRLGRLSGIAEDDLSAFLKGNIDGYDYAAFLDGQEAAK